MILRHPSNQQTCFSSDDSRGRLCLDPGPEIRSNRRNAKLHVSETAESKPCSSEVFLLEQLTMGEHRFLSKETCPRYED